MAAIKTDEEIAEELVSELIQKPTKSIVLYNDKNTFEHVINCLVKYCNHEEHQAEQCANIVHYKGKYAVKVGPIEKLVPIYAALTGNGLTCEIT